MTTKKTKLKLAAQESGQGKDLSDQNLAEIMAEYEQTLVIPNQKPGHPYALCPVGLPGTGKTTVVKELSKRLHLLRINSDDLRKLLTVKGYNLLRTIDLSTALSSKYAKQGYSLAIDADCAGKFVTQKLYRLVESAGLKLIWVHLNTPKDYVISQIKKYRTEQSLKDYYRRQPLHEQLNLPFSYVFDLSQPNLEEQYDQAEEKIRQETGNLK